MVKILYCKMAALQAKALQAKALQDKKFAAKHLAHYFFNNLNQPITNLH